MVEQYQGVKVIEFNGNFGQHMAILAAFEVSSGEIVITLDADLQNPPEEIPRLMAEIEKGHDVVGTIRQQRQDQPSVKWHRGLSISRPTRSPGCRCSDYGCMLRAYHRYVIDNINRCKESTTFIPALAQTFASNPTEIEVAHAERADGESKYSLYKLIRLNFDLMTGFSVVPLQLFALFGIITSVLSLAFALFLLVRRFHRRCRGGGGLYPVCDPVLLHRHHHYGDRYRWRICRQDLSGSPEATEICGQKDLRF